jgi:hypothetical protein
MRKILAKLKEEFFAILPPTIFQRPSALSRDGTKVLLLNWLAFFNLCRVKD